jgi:hypothetical protein
MATDSTPSPTAKPTTSPASNRLTPTEIESLREHFQRMGAKIEAALAAERARRATEAAEWTAFSEELFLSGFRKTK